MLTGAGRSTKLLLRALINGVVLRAGVFKGEVEGCKDEAGKLFIYLKSFTITYFLIIILFYLILVFKAFLLC